MHYLHLFGPVRSRRLGISLGIDLVPGSTCSLDCIYCECGKTHHLTLRRAEYAPTDEIFDELDLFLRTEPELDYITLGGTGEPTLHSEIRDILDFIHSSHPRYKTAVLTNSTTLHDPQIRSEIRSADLILPSLDAVSSSVFNAINRPPPGIETGMMIDGLINLRNEYTKAIWLEIFLIPGLNTHESELLLLREAAVSIRPDILHLNSLHRPGAEPGIRAPSESEKKRICRFFREQIPETYII
ncbi:MAG: radical SAM protein [Methanocalculus sp. MSAO_Arc1]|uniref:radical SAM protein n=1 Tax=unclassified Methanocalculus TaxID=2631035 RepID=UPI000FF622B6|nr:MULTISPECIES: radical SAM protein [unclassified Methanocalculus]MCP1661795.1 wyosine [tRNA(Phe)-imidazoG37] synthetase (radical SAM superfamily) [Methanocalculus sp. AMF5]RQD80187.1 MAG: radical SAM protein [Methanocalculus sp. MSAO_Arc1]